MGEMALRCCSSFSTPAFALFGDSEVALPQLFNASLSIRYHECCELGLFRVGLVESV